MILVSVVENDKQPVNWSTFSSLTEMYRGIASGLDLQKFIAMSNFTLYAAFFEFDVENFIKGEEIDSKIYHPITENLADTLYEYMYDHLDVYYDLIRQIDDYRGKVDRYKVDK